MVYTTIQHPPPPPPTATHCLYKYTVHLLWVGGGGEVREKVEGQQYTSIVPSSMGATVHKLGGKCQPWVNVSPVYKICQTHAAKSVNRSIVKKSRHIGFGVIIVYSSMFLVQTDNLAGVNLRYKLHFRQCVSGIWNKAERYINNLTTKESSKTPPSV
jgi:hypothetical protein